MTSIADVISGFDGVQDRELLRMSKLAEVKANRLEFATKHHINTRG